MGTEGGCPSTRALDSAPLTPKPHQGGISRPTAALDSHVSQGRVDIVVGVPISGDEEGQAAVWRQHIHAAVFVSVPGQQGDAAVLHVQGRRDRVQGLRRRKRGQSMARAFRVSSQLHEES